MCLANTLLRLVQEARWRWSFIGHLNIEVQLRRLSPTSHDF